MLPCVPHCCMWQCCHLLVQLSCCQIVVHVGMYGTAHPGVSPALQQLPLCTGGLGMLRVLRVLICPSPSPPLTPPRLDLQPGELPRCFEGELRRGPQHGAELMHLVSGRTLLGVVRLRVGVRSVVQPWIGRNEGQAWGYGQF